MAELPITRPSLLVRLRDSQDDEAWRQFVEVYAPLIYGLARKRGLQDADAADLTQEVLQSVAAAIKGLDYNPLRGTFRGWLYTVTRNRLHNFLERRGRHVQGSGDTTAQHRLEEQPTPDARDAAEWDQEYERRLFAWAAEQVRGGFQETSWQAFWQTAVEGKSATAVASGLGLTVGAVYIAKSRVMARLKEQIRLVQEE